MLCCRIAPLVFPARNLGYKITEKVALGRIDAAASLYCVFPLRLPRRPLQRTALRKKLINQLILFSRRALCKQVCNDPTKKQKVSNPRHLFASFVLCGEKGIRRSSHRLVLARIPNQRRLQAEQQIQYNPRNPQFKRAMPALRRCRATARGEFCLVLWRVLAHSHKHKTKQTTF